MYNASGMTFSFAGTSALCLSFYSGTWESLRSSCDSSLRNLEGSIHDHVTTNPIVVISRKFLLGFLSQLLPSTALYAYGQYSEERILKQKWLVVV